MAAMPSLRPQVAQMFGGGGFHGHAVGVKAQAVGHAGLHLGDIAEKFRSLSYYGDVNIAYTVALVGHKLSHLPQQHHRVGTLPGVVGGREMVTYITQGGSPEKGVAEGMERHIGIAVAQQAVRVRHLYAAKHQVAALHQTVNVEPQSGSYIIYFHSASFSGKDTEFI